MQHFNVHRTSQRINRNSVVLNRCAATLNPLRPSTPQRNSVALQLAIGLSTVHRSINRNSVALQPLQCSISTSIGHLNASTATPLFSTVAQQHSTGFAPQHLNATPLPFNWPKADQPSVGLFNAAGISTSLCDCQPLLCSFLTQLRCFQRRRHFNCSSAALNRRPATNKHGTTCHLQAPPLHPFSATFCDGRCAACFQRFNVLNI